MLEARDFEGEGVSLRELAERRYETEEDASRLSSELVRHNLATLHENGNQVHLTPEGWQRACEIVRNHRLCSVRGHLEVGSGTGGVLPVIT